MLLCAICLCCVFLPLGCVVCVVHVHVHAWLCVWLAQHGVIELLSLTLQRVSASCVSHLCVLCALCRWRVASSIASQPALHYPQISRSSALPIRPLAIPSPPLSSCSVQARIWHRWM